jgi:hypothetical protein
VFYELVFETGAKSVAYYDSEEEMQSAVTAHHLRAINGEPAMPLDRSAERMDLDPSEKQPLGEVPAERIKRVFAYEDHPADLYEDQGLSTDVVEKELQAALKSVDEKGVTYVPDLAGKVRELTSPLVADAGRHASQYKAEGKEINLGFLKEDS